MAQPGKVTKRTFAVVAGIVLLLIGMVPASDAQSAGFIGEVEINPALVTGAVIIDEGKILRGHYYRAEISGFYFFESALSHARADAECARNSAQEADRVWLPNRYGTATPDNTADDPLDVLVDGRTVDWVPVGESNPFGCNATGHHYDVNFKALSDGRVTFAVYDPFNQADNSLPDENTGNRLGVKLFSGIEPETRPEDIPTGAALVDVANEVGVTLPVLAGQSYRLVSSGTYRYWLNEQDLSDAECTTPLSGDQQEATIEPDDPAQWVSNRYGTYEANTGEDAPDLIVNSIQVDWHPLQDTGGGCNASPIDPNSGSLGHAYSHIFTARQDTLHLVINHPYRPFAEGSLLVRLFLIRPESLTELPIPSLDGSSPGTAPGVLRQLIAGPLYVDSRDLVGVSTTLDAGQAYVIEAAGKYNFGSASFQEADAECTRNLLVENDPTWLPDRYSALTADDPFDDLGDLYVNGRAVDWRPAVGGGVCDEDISHRYNVRFVPTTTGMVNFRIHDTNAGDNAGGIYVNVYLDTQPVPHTTDVLVSTVLVDSHDPKGFDIALAPGNYKFLAKGIFSHEGDPNTYGYWDFSTTKADVECSRDQFRGWGRQLWTNVSEQGGDVLDLYVDKQPRDWVPLLDTGGGCNTNDHTYGLEFQLDKAKLVNLKIHDVYYVDNKGNVQIQIYSIHDDVTLPSTSFEDI